MHIKPQLKMTASQNNEKSSPNEEVYARLMALTKEFRSKLKPADDDYQGNRKGLLSTDYAIINKYISDFTKIWKQQNKEFKQNRRNIFTLFINLENIYINTSANFNKRVPEEIGPISCKGAVFNDLLIFNKTAFLGRVDFSNATFSGLAEFSQSHFAENVIFDASEFLEPAYFSACNFSNKVRFHMVKFSGGVLDFSYAKFKRTPSFHDSKLPQGSSFDEALIFGNFRKLSQEELVEEATSLRTLKQVASNYRGQQDEAKFFSLEQKARRLAFLAPHIVWNGNRSDAPKCGLRGIFDKNIWRNMKSWKLRCKPFDWILSLGYGLISEYGGHAGKAASSFLIFNLAFGLLIKFCFSFGDCSKGADYCLSGASSKVLSIKTPEIFLILQNLLNPSSIISDKNIFIVQNNIITAASLAHFSVSYVVLFLTALAIKGKFQKGGGGEK